MVWARRSQIARFAALAQTITEHRDGIRASIGRGASNGRVEAMNTGIRLLARKAYGFHSPDGMISLATLKHGGLCLPCRAGERLLFPHDPFAAQIRSHTWQQGPSPRWPATRSPSP